MSIPDPSQLPVGKLFHGHYEIVRCIAAGAMGTVYEVIDQKTRRRRALKVMLPSLVSDPELRARFKLEATITADIVSEHIVETFDADVDADTGAPFLVMELLRGEDLADTLSKRKRLPAEEVILYLSQAARALDKTHAAGIIHRDLKPENLFVTHRDDGSPRVKVLDFGIAKVVAQSAGKTTTRSIGTPPYMSPEQISGENVTAKSDLYALAHIAFALLVGQPYWLEEARSSEAVYPLLVKIMKGAKEPAIARAKRLGATLPSDFEDWFMRATSVDVDERHESARELVSSLAAVMNVTAPVPSLSASVGDWSLIADRNALLASIAAHQTRKSAPTVGQPVALPEDARKPAPDSQRSAAALPAEAQPLADLPPPLPKLFGGVPADDRISAPSEPPKSSPQAGHFPSVPPISASSSGPAAPALSNAEQSASGSTASDLSSTITRQNKSGSRRMILGAAAMFMFGLLASFVVLMGKSGPETDPRVNASTPKEPVFEIETSTPAAPASASLPTGPAASETVPASSASAAAAPTASAKTAPRRPTKVTKTGPKKKKYDPLGDL